ncbi:hypothetical protein ES332_A07G106200v1 [Gossypium tomentosum]|uniref:Uncharacterized protein n=1 Tax=Gossypium tomentosum TaxID=34277 RepID=A0A5D2PRZ0_GOSTO|nr:hypothetical protein ES332_A07G106200v1 [Gossypium tomentosum]
MARRVKRVTDPLDDRVKAQLVGAVYFSSGSEHSASDAVAGEDSPCLSELVDSFLEDNHYGTDETGGGNGSTTYISDADYVDSKYDNTASLESSDQTLLTIGIAIGICSWIAFWNQRKWCYDAAICKTKWSSSGGITAGNYEFIDVMRSVSSSRQKRYFVDLDFASEFEIAMPTGEYSRLLQYCPKAFVGKSEELKKIVRAMSDAAKRSLKSKGLSLPPWRKNRYMQNKWFASYRRTTNQTSADSGWLTTMTIHSVSVVQCRYVGFDDAVNSRMFVRTR